MAFSREEIERAQAKKLAAMTANPPGPELTEEQRREIYEQEKAKREEVTLTEEDRQRIYEEEKAKEEEHGDNDPTSEETDAPKNRGSIGCLGLIVLIFLIGWISSLVEDKPKKPKLTAAQQIEQTAERERKEAVELAGCKKDLQCWGNRNIPTAGFACDDHIERLAKYSFEWTDGWLEQKFSRFRWKSKPKVLTYFGDKIKMQNGFGAWQQYTYECDLNTETDTALAVRAEPGRLG